jgi:hypothetical protein
MRRGLVVAIVVVAGCGRVHFDTGDAQGMNGDGARDDGAGPDATIDPDLIAWYPLDGDPALGAPDATGHGFDAACGPGGCPTTVIGIHGPAFHFDGVNKALVVPYHPAFDTTTGTVAMWVRSTVPLAAVQISEIVNKPFAGIARKSWEAYLTDNPTLLEAGADASIGNYVTYSSPPFDTWYALAFTWDTMFRLYIDGTEHSSCPFTPAFDTQGMYLGAGLDTGVLQYYFGGDLDDVRVYRRALTAPEILALAQP